MKTPHDFIKEAGDIINQRGTDNGYDKGQERSAAQIAAVFNALSGRDLTEHEIWLLQICVKLVRNQSKRRDDNILDLIGYAALMGESQQPALGVHDHTDALAAVMDNTPQQVASLAMIPVVTREEAQAARDALRTEAPVRPEKVKGVARRALDAEADKAKSEGAVGDSLLSGVALEIATGHDLDRRASVLHTQRLTAHGREDDQALRARLIQIRKMQASSRPRTPRRFA